MNFSLTEFSNNLIFLEPIFLYLLFPILAFFIFWLVLVFIEIKTRPAETYGSKYPLLGKTRLYGFVMVAAVFMVLALAKPHLPGGSIVPSRGSVEVIIVVDRSISMRGDDVRESRLEIAKREALRIQSILTAGDKVALFVFGREPHRKVYLTTDHDSVFGQVLEINFPKSLKGDGLIWDSDFAGLLEKIYFSMDRQDSAGDKAPQKKTNRIVILLTDGEDQERKSKPVTDLEKEYKSNYLKRLNKALKEFQARGLKIYPVGIGTIKGVSQPSLLRGYKEGEDYDKDDPDIKNWKGKSSRLDRDNLMFLAKSTEVDLSGYVWTIQNSSTNVGPYLTSVINQNRSALLEFTATQDDQKLWQYLLLIAVAVMAAGILSYPFAGYMRKKS